MKKIILTFIIIMSMFTISFAENNTSSFDNYYEKWKKEHGVTTEIPYQNSTDGEKAQSARTIIDETFEKKDIEDLKQKTSSNREAITKNNEELRILKNIIITSNSIYILTVIILIIIILKKNKKVSD